MGDRLQTGKPSWCVASHPGQLSLAIPPWVGATSTSESWDVNRHTARCTSPISVVWQCKPVYGWGLIKRRSAPLCGPYGSGRNLRFLRYAAVDTAAYELAGKQPVLYLPPPPEHPPPSDIGSPPDSPQSDPRYPPIRRLLHSDCEPSSPAQRRTGNVDALLLFIVTIDVKPFLRFFVTVLRFLTFFYFANVFLFCFY